MFGSIKCMSMALQSVVLQCFSTTQYGNKKKIQSIKHHYFSAFGTYTDAQYHEQKQ